MIADKNKNQLDGVDDNINRFIKIDDLFDQDFDILFVCLVNNVAAETTIRGLKKGCHVFCEKPPGMNVNEIEQVIKVEKKFPNLKLKYGFNHRYHDSVEKAISIVKNKTLGEIVNLRGVYGKSMIIPFSGGWRSQKELSGGGILLDQGIHMLDLMRLFSGEFKEVKSYISNSFWNHEVEDNAYALLKDYKGRISMINSSATQWHHKFTLEINLTEGYIILDGIVTGSKSYGNENIIIGKRDRFSEKGQLEFTQTQFLDDNSWEKEINSFIDSIINDKDILSGSSHDALECMKLVFGIYNADINWKENRK